MDIVWKKSSFMPSCQICLLSPVISDDRSGFFQRGTEKSPKFSIQWQIARFEPVFDGPGDPDKGKKPERQEFLWSFMPRNHQKRPEAEADLLNTLKRCDQSTGFKGLTIPVSNPEDGQQTIQAAAGKQNSICRLHIHISGKWFF